jgi:formylglycine-generating enzyme required for sulfatase activity
MTVVAPAVMAQEGAVFRDCPDCPEMTTLPDGSAMGTTLVTVADYRVFATETAVEETPGCYTRGPNDWRLVEGIGWSSPGFEQGDDHPAVCVSWVEATAYADWLSERTGKPYRLPTVEESAAATAAGSTTLYWWGDDLGDICARANLADARYRASYPEDERKMFDCDDGFTYTAPVRSFPPNPWGIYDAVGNAWVWTNSCHKGDCAVGIFRGAAWTVPNPKFLETAGSFQDRIILRNASVGFRVMRDPE